jgi:tetratricopeptide (TPR) repeat protein
VLSRDQAPADWATAQTNLGTALHRLAERTGNRNHLIEALTCYRAALDVRDRDHVPTEWVTTHINLGAALAALGETEPGSTRLDEAHQAFAAALAVAEAHKLTYLAAQARANLVELDRLRRYRG